MKKHYKSHEAQTPVDPTPTTPLNSFTDGLISSVSDTQFIEKKFTNSIPDGICKSEY
jgi:hypothetical protein